jgi:integrase
VPVFPRIDVDNVRTEFFEEAEVTAILEALPEAVRPVVRFAHLTGWRIPSEVLTLTWDRVDFFAGVIRLDPGTTKNREGRTFPFDVSPELESLLKSQRLEAELGSLSSGGKIAPWVFHRNGRQIKSFRGAWARACKDANLEGRVGHDFRRTAVRNFVRAGVPERVAMMLTGHKTRSVFDRYNIVNEADLRAGVAKLASVRSIAQDAPKPAER